MKPHEKQGQIPDPWDSRCPSREVLNLIGNKWTLLIFPLLHQGPLRNSELLRRIDGISQKVLTDTLRQLEIRGLIHRHDYATVPPKVEYSLTELGRSLASLMGLLDQWVIDHYFDMAKAVTKYKRRTRRNYGTSSLPG